VPSNHIAAQDRVAPASDHVLIGPVTLMNSFAVSPGRAKHSTSCGPRPPGTSQPSRGSSPCGCTAPSPPGAQYRWVNVANWESEAHFRAAHGTDEFRRVVTQPGWEEFPSSPVLYQVITEAG
jgi:hypothetical protein